MDMRKQPSRDAEAYLRTISGINDGVFSKIVNQPAITRSKLTIETLEQGVKYVIVSLLLTLKIFHTLF